jgi:hypothetical protein
MKKLPQGVRKELEIIAGNLPIMLDTSMEVRYQVRGSTLLANGIKEGKEIGKVKEDKTYLNKLEGKVVNHFKNLKKIYLAGPTEAIAKANLIKYNQEVMRKFNETTDLGTNSK